MRGLGWSVEVRKGLLKGILMSRVTSGWLGLCRAWTSRAEPQDTCRKPAIVDEGYPGLCAGMDSQLQLAFCSVVLLILMEQTSFTFRFESMYYLVL